LKEGKNGKEKRMKNSSTTAHQKTSAVDKSYKRAKEHKLNYKKIL